MSTIGKEAKDGSNDNNESQSESKMSTNQAARLAISLGLAGYRYGSPAVHVQSFVEKAFEKFTETAATSSSNSSDKEDGDDEKAIVVSDITSKPKLVACCRLSQSECFLSIETKEEENGSQSQISEDFTAKKSFGPLVYMKAAQNGCHLDKLSRLSMLAENLLTSSSSTTHYDACDIQSKLDAIETAPNPWGTILNFLAWVACGVALPPVFGCTWPDIILGGVTATASFVIAYGIDLGCSMTTPGIVGRIARRLAPWTSLLQAYQAAAIASICQAYWSNATNPVLVTIGAIAIPLPGYGISAGVIELAADNITGGLSHIIKGLITLVLLAVGAALGIATGNAIQTPEPLQENIVFVSNLWQILWLPMLCTALAIALQNSPRDFIWSILCGGITYAVSYGGAVLVPNRANIGYFFGGLALTVVSNIWGNVTRRSPLPLMIPSFILSISGSIGFRGLLNISKGSDGLGGEEFWQMFVVAGVTMAGILVGYFVVKPTNVL